MTPNILLEQLKLFIEEQTKELLLPVRVRPESGDMKMRPANVHLMNLPDVKAGINQIPYIVLQFLTGKDVQKEGAFPKSECSVRIITAAYSENASDGQMDILNLITRIRIALLKQGVIGRQFILKPPLEYIVYQNDPDKTSPYFFGEMMSNWDLPAINREVENLWY